MKIRNFLLIALIMISISTKAAFKEIHTTRLPFSPSVHNCTHTGDFKYFLCSTRADMVMFDGTNGNILWHINFEKNLSNKKFINQFWNQTANVILVYDEDTRKAVATKYFIDGKTGNMLWKSEKYVSDMGSYELSDGFEYYFDPETNGVLLPTKESVEFVDVTNGNVIWEKKIQLTGKPKDFDCFLMNYYDLVKVETGKDEAFYLTTREGNEVSDIEPYFNKKKFLADKKHASIITIPEKNMYVIMQGETSNLFRLLGADLPKWKMTFIAYDMKTDQEIWRKQHMASHAFNWITYEPFINFFYAEDKIFVEHDPNGTSASGLTVLDVKNGEKLWECNYTTSETKNSGLTKTYLTPFPAPHPVIYDNLVYVVDKNKNRLSCYQLQTGTLVWESERFSDAQKIPSLFVTEGVVILGLGGAATKNVRLSPASGPVTYSNEYIIKDEYGIMAFDAKSGKKIWDGKSISKSAKDKFDFIAGIEHVNDKLYCATNKNFFIIDPKTGAIKNNIPVAKEKLGDIWGMTFFPEQKKIILNLKNGIIKIDAQNALLEGKIKTPNIPFIPATEYINANCDYEDYAIFVSGDSKKMDFKQFASIDLNNMTIRGTEDAKLLFYQIPHFSDGADFFYKLDGSLVKFYSMK